MFNSFLYVYQRLNAINLPGLQRQTSGAEFGGCLGMGSGWSPGVTPVMAVGRPSGKLLQFAIEKGHRKFVD